MSVINNMIDKTVRCVKCNTTKADGCGCWVELQCPKCNAKRTVEKHETDPTGTKIINVTCPECDKGDFAECLYFDANNNQLYVA